MTPALQKVQKPNNEVLTDDLHHLGANWIRIFKKLLKLVLNNLDNQRHKNNGKEQSLLLLTALVQNRSWRQSITPSLPYLPINLFEYLHHLSGQGKLKSVLGVR